MSHRPSFITDLKERKSGKYVQPLDRLIYNVLVLIEVTMLVKLWYQPKVWHWYIFIQHQLTR